MVSFSYDFEADTLGGLPANTTSLRGTWSVVSSTELGSKTVRCNSASAGTYQDSMLDLMPVSHKIDISMRIDGDRNCVTLFASEDGTKGYTVQMDYRNDNRIEIYRRDNSQSPAVTLLAVGAMVTSTDSKWRFTAEASGGTTTLKVYSWDGSTWTQRASTTDSAYVKGHVALTSIGPNNALQFDDIEIEAEVSPVILLTSPVSFQFDQRDANGEVTFAVTGSYIGEPTVIEYRFAGGGWGTLDAAPSNGTFSGSIVIDQQGDLEVRFANDTDVTDTAESITPADVFLVFGQSNASGRLLSLQNYSHATLKACMYRETGTFAELSDPTDPEATTGSPWLLLATLLMNEHDVPVAFITTADGGTKVVGGTWNPNTPGTSYSQAVSRVISSGVTGIKAALCDLGESDISGDSDPATYKTLMGQLVDALQSSTGLTFPTIMAMTGAYPDEDSEQIDAIRQMQMALWDEDDSVVPGPVGYNRRKVHWESNAEGTKLASLWWAAIDDAVYGVATGRGPRVVSAKMNDDRDEITVTFDRDLHTDTSYAAASFTVDNPDGTTRTITSATRTGTRTVLLALSGDLDGDSPTLSFARGNNGSNVTVPQSAAITLPATIHSTPTVMLPAEPLYDFAIAESDPVLTEIVISPATARILIGGTQQFAAETLDQRGNPIDAGAIEWAATGSGSIDETGLYTAPASPESAVISAAAGGKVATASVLVVDFPVVVSGPAWIVPGQSINLSLSLDNPIHELIVDGNTISGPSSGLIIDIPSDAPVGKVATLRIDHDRGTIEMVSMIAEPITDVSKESSVQTVLEAVENLDGPGAPTGPGGIPVVIPVTSNNQPVDGAAVWITTDPEGTNQIAGVIHTDTFGNTNPAFTLEAGIFYVWVQKAGINFPNPQAIEVLENGTYQWHTG